LRSSCLVLPSAVIYDKSTFYANNRKNFLGPIGHQLLWKKGVGLSLHVSDFLTIDGYLKTEETILEACVFFFY
jgi:hypothetical protein